MPRISIPAKTHKLILPLPASLRLLARLDDDKFSILRDEVRGAKAFDQNRRRCDSLAKALGLSSLSDATGLLVTLEFLYDRARTWADEQEDPIKFVEEFLKSTELWSDLGDDPDVTFKRLAELLAENPVYEKQQKRSWLRTGLLDTATSFASFIDLRPNFTKDRSRIEELIPTVIFSIETETETGENKISVFQMSEIGLKRLQKAIEDALAKINTIKQDKILKGLLVSDTLEQEDK